MFIGKSYLNLSREWIPYEELLGKGVGHVIRSDLYSHSLMFKVTCLTLYTHIN